MKTEWTGKKSSYIICPAASVVPMSWVSITPWNPPRRLQAAMTQKWWLVCVGVVLNMAQDGWPPPTVASSTASWCSSRDSALGWCQPLGGVGARCSHGAVRVQSVAHTMSEEVGLSLLSTLLPPAKAPKHHSKPSDSRQDEMLCHRRFRVLSACRRRPILDPLCLHRGVHMDHDQDQLIQLTVQSK
jgi:hypothetical protein